MCKECVWSATEKSHSFVKSLFDSKYGECEIKLFIKWAWHNSLVGAMTQLPYLASFTLVELRLLSKNQEEINFSHNFPIKPK